MSILLKKSVHWSDTGHHSSSGYCRTGAGRSSTERRNKDDWVRGNNESEA